MKTFSLPQKYQYAALAALFGLAAWGTSYNLAINHYFSFFVQGIVSSTSYFVKTPLTLGFLSFCFFLCFCSEIIPVPKIRYPKNILYFLLMAFIFLSVKGHIDFLKKFDLSLDLFASYHFSFNNIPEISRFSHLHIMKPLAYLLIKTIAFPGASWNIDPENFWGGHPVGAGYSFLGYMPISFYTLSAIAYVGIIVLILMLIIAKKQAWTTQRIPLLLTLFLACFGVLENLIDGGPFSIEFFFPFLLLLFLINLDDSKALPKQKKTIVLFFVFFFILSFIYFVIRGLIIGSYLFTLTSYIALYLSPLLLSIAWQKKDRLSIVCILSVLFLVFVCCRYDWGNSLQKDYSFFQSKLLRPRTIWITSFNKILPLKIVVEDPPLRIYETSALKGQSLIDISRQYGLDCRMRYNPFALLDTSACSLEPETPGNGFDVFRGYVKLQKGIKAQISPVKTAYWQVQIEPSLQGPYDYAFLIYTHKCVQPIKDLLINFLLQRSLGVTNFVVIK